MIAARAATRRKTIPFENANAGRPRVCNWSGQLTVLPSTEPSTGTVERRCWPPPRQHQDDCGYDGDHRNPMSAPSYCLRDLCDKASAGKPPRGIPGELLARIVDTGRRLLGPPDDAINRLNCDCASISNVRCRALRDVAFETPHPVAYCPPRHRSAPRTTGYDRATRNTSAKPGDRACVRRA